MGSGSADTREAIINTWDVPDWLRPILPNLWGIDKVVTLKISKDEYGLFHTELIGRLSRKDKQQFIRELNLMFQLYRKGVIKLTRLHQTGLLKKQEPSEPTKLVIDRFAAPMLARDKGDE